MMNLNVGIKGLVLLSAMILSFGTSIPEAKACGGFFCNPGLFNGQPTIQTGERILFTVDDDNIRAYVQVYFDGPAADFAWIVPVATVPDVGVGTDQVFTVLENMTRPQFQVDFEVADNCSFYPSTIWENEWSEGGGEEGEFPAEGDAGYVNVLAEGKAGPYNYEIVESNNSEILVAWLNENDYEQPPEALPLIEHYVAKEMKFVAVKLQPGKTTGDIAPIILDFQEQSPCIPLVLTSVAAEENMPVKAYVLGGKRSVPTNWLHVTVNQKKLDWFSLDGDFGGMGFGNLGSSYENVLMEAIEEAEGHAFTTEYAGPSSVMNNQLNAGQYDNVSTLQEIESPADFVNSLGQFFAGSNQLLSILQQFIPLPEGYTELDFYNNPLFYVEEYEAINPDLDALYNAIIDAIVTPVLEAQEMFDQFPYLTRLYSRVPLKAMDRDPIFDFQDIGDVPRLRKATFHMTCEDGGKSFYMELENGETFVPTNYPTGVWEGFDPEENLYNAGSVNVEELPAADTIVVYAPGKEPRRINADDAAYVDDQLQTTPPEDVDVPEFVEEVPEGGAPVSTQGNNVREGCSSTGLHTLFPLLGLLVLALSVRRRRLNG